MNGTDTKPRSAPSARNWRVRLNLISDTMREMSRQTDPQEMVCARTRPACPESSAATA